MLKVNFKVDTTSTVLERTAFDSLVLFGDIGGLKDFIYMCLTPVMAFLLGNRYQYSLFSRLFWVNDAKKGRDQS